MKQYIFNLLKIILFLTIFIFLYKFLSCLQKPASIDLENITGFYAEEENSLDVVYIGGSAAFVYWEPLTAYENHGITSYLFSANTIQPEFYEYMIKELYTKQNPELIILDARAFQYRDVDQPPSAVAYRNVLTGMPFTKNKYEFIENNVPKYLNEDTASYHFDLKFYHTNDEMPSLAKAINIMFNNNKNLLKGFYFVPKAMRMKKLDFNTDEVQAPYEATVEILNDLLDYLKEKDTKVLFVVSPYIENKKEKQIFNYVEDVVKKAGFDFLDANEYADVMKLDYDTDFYNYNHVNIYGADKYTEFLSNYIISNYEIVDRRNDSKYSEWDLLLKNWHILVQNTKNEINNIYNGKGYADEIFIKQ